MRNRLIFVIFILCSLGMASFIIKEMKNVEADKLKYAKLMQATANAEKHTGELDINLLIADTTQIKADTQKTGISNALTNMKTAIYSVNNTLESVNKLIDSASNLDGLNLTD